MSSPIYSNEPKRRDSVSEMETTIDKDQKQNLPIAKESDGKHQDADNQPVQVAPERQIPRRHSSATPQPKQLQQLQQKQVSHTNPGRIPNKRIPPAVPVRNRKPISTGEENTQNSTANTPAQNNTAKPTAQNNTAKTSAQNSIPANTLAQNGTEKPPAQNSTTVQNSQNQQANPVVPDSKNDTVETNTNENDIPLPIANPEPALPTKTLPTEKPISPKEKSPEKEQIPLPNQANTKTNLPTPPAIPPPPMRQRRASACVQNSETLLDPQNATLKERRSSSPFQNYAGQIDNDFLKPYLQNRENSLSSSQSTPSSLNSSQKPLNKKSTESLANKESDDAKKTNETNKTSDQISQPSTILTKNYHELKRQSTLSNGNKKRISQIKVINGCAIESTAQGKMSKEQKLLMKHSTTESSESGPGSVKIRVLPDKIAQIDSKVSVRQDSNVSSDSVSQTSSPSYTTKTMETPLLPHHARKNLVEMITAAQQNAVNNAVLTKSASTPASLQTCVKFSGSNMTLQHKIIRDIKQSSSNTRGKLKFRIIQIVVNVLILSAIVGGLIFYFNSNTPPPMIKYVNKTITTTVAVIPPETNPAPGFCFKLVIDFCVNHKVPYNYTTFPNHVVNMNQDQAEQELDLYDAIVDVRCYELSALFLCSVFVPKCGPQGELLYPCRSLCEETKRRCGFFIDVFGLPALPDYLRECTLLPDSENPDVCVGHREVKQAKLKASRPRCSKDGFLCDITRCIPQDWRCDGHLDCEDQTDEKGCDSRCTKGTVHCGESRCMNNSIVCDGIIDCPYGQDERNCIRLQDNMGDVGRGLLQVYDPKIDDWIPACVSNWDNKQSAQAICALMGYSSANFTRLIIKDTNVEVQAPKTVNLTEYKKRSNWIRDFRSCGLHHYPIVNLECRNYECGKKRNPIAFHSKRIVGGYQSAPGSWPFLAAIHGGPEEIFYCAGVLIADQWVLTASHCVGNASESSLSGWKIQLGVTRRHSHSYFGQKANVRRVIAHPLYNIGVNHDNDVALFQLREPVNFNENVLPVCLPPAGLELRPGMNCTVIGWGKSEDDECSEYEPALHEVEVPIINRKLCNEWMIYRDLNVTDGMICAGLAEGGKDACQGDSGGPLLCPFDRYKKRWFVGGIVSWGIKCAHPQLPGVYAYVPKYVTWIKEQMLKYTD